MNTAETEKPIRVIIVDDQILFAASLKVVLTAYDKKALSIVGLAKNGIECLELLKTETCDVILMDVRMPEMDGVEATRIIRKQYPRVQIMMLTTFDDDSYVSQALQAGATGYVLKNIEPDELFACVMAVAKGTMLVSPSVGYRLFSQGADAATAPGGSSGKSGDLHMKINYLQSRFPDLKKREAEVLYLVIKGMDNHEISDSLMIASQTVKNYTSMIYAKIGVDDRLHAIQMLGFLANDAESRQ